MISGSLWALMDTQPRRVAGTLRREELPQTPGVYAWYRDGEPVYAGRAIGKKGLQERVGSKHLATGVDLSHSSFRRNVCEHLGIADTSLTRQRPPQLNSEQVQRVNDWVRECEVAWIVCRSQDEAKMLERELLAEWKPPLSKR